MAPDGLENLNPSEETGHTTFQKHPERPCLDLPVCLEYPFTEHLHTLRGPLRKLMFLLVYTVPCNSVVDPTK